MIEAAKCDVCGKTVMLTNIDKLRGVVGLTYGWVHVNRFGRIKRSRHTAVVNDYFDR